MPDIYISYEEEAKLLAVVSELFAGPYACSECRDKITEATGWKPQVLYVMCDNGMHQIRVNFLCGPCQLILSTRYPDSEEVK